MVLAFSLSTNAQDSTKVDNFQKTDEVLAEVVKKALSVAEKTGEFAIEQAPLLLQEFYSWHITKESLGIALSFILLFVVYRLHKKLKKYKTEENLDFSDAEYFFPTMGIYAGFLIFTISLIADIYDLVFILIAPKLYLIEYFVK